ncbi:MAG: hypothetical protein WC488_03440 [Candidatus Micrarchaeia archaeon]
MTGFSGAIVILLVAALLLCGCAGSGAKEGTNFTSNITLNHTNDDSSGNSTTEPLPARESKIPLDIAKVMPSEDVYPPIMHSDEWEAPVPAPGMVNTAGAEDSAFATPDGSTLYFFFTPDVRVPPEKQLLDGVTGIYASKKLADGSWGTAERVVLQEPGKLALDGCGFVQGNMMWFCSAREGYSGVNLFTAQFSNGEWRNIRYVGDKLMKEYQMGEMHITSGGSEMYFHSARSGGKGMLDIWASRNVNGEWGEPENVGIVNSPENEGWPFLSQDRGELWLTRTVNGTPAVLRSRNVNGSWTEPELIISQFAGEASLDDEGNIYFTHHFYRNGTMIEADIYVAGKK